MHALDETDLHILEPLAEDARYPFSDISTEVGLSASAASGRIDRFREEDIIRRFTVDLDQPMFSGRTPVLVKLLIRPEFVDEAYDALHAADPVQHLLVATDGEVTTHARLDGGSIRAQLDELADPSRVHDYEMSLVESAKWSPTVSGIGFALGCAECGNTTTSESESIRVGGSLHHLYCSSCLDRFENRYNRLEAGVNGD